MITPWEATESRAVSEQVHFRDERSGVVVVTSPGAFVSRSVASLSQLWSYYIACSKIVAIDT